MAVSMDGPDVVVDVAWSPDGVLQFTTPQLGRSARTPCSKHSPHARLDA